MICLVVTKDDPQITYNSEGDKRGGLKYGSNEPSEKDRGG